MATGVISVLGVATLGQVDHPPVLFASMPMLFALHQFTEGLGWLGPHGRTEQVAFDHAAFLFLLYAQVRLALAVLLMESAGWRRLPVGGAPFVGAAVCAWTTHRVVAHPSRAFVDQHSIAHRNPLTDSGWIWRTRSFARPES